MIFFFLSLSVIVSEKTYNVCRAHAHIPCHCPHLCPPRHSPKNKTKITLFELNVSLCNALRSIQALPRDCIWLMGEAAAQRGLLY